MLLVMQTVLKMDLLLLLHPINNGGARGQGKLVLFPRQLGVVVLFSVSAAKSTRELWRERRDDPLWVYEGPSWQLAGVKSRPLCQRSDFHHVYDCLLDLLCLGYK